MNLLKQIRILLYAITLVRHRLIYQVGLESLGVDVSPIDKADDVVGCAESLTMVLRKAGIKIPVILGTWTLEHFFQKSSKWKQVYTPRIGDVLVSATGTGRSKNDPEYIQGHTGVIGKNGTIMSSVSFGKNSGKWMSTHSIETWKNRYVDKGLMKMNYYRLK